MTKKRYHKLFRAAMTRLMAGYPGAGKCIKAAATADPIRNGAYKSYAEAWDGLMDFRKSVGME